MAEGKTYNIPAARFDWFKTQLETLGRKAKKLNGERLFLTAVGFHNEEDEKSPWHGQKIMEVFVACPEPKLNGWDFVARIDHAHEVGNIVRTTGLMTLPEMYRERGPVCDHCGHKRQRRDTFVVHKEEEGFKQVGSSCLKDFLGHGDADRIAKLAELLANIHSFVRGSFDDESAGLNDNRWIHMDQYLEYVAHHVVTFGFVSKATSYSTGRESTAESALRSYNCHNTMLLTPEVRELAANAREWAANLDETETQPLNDYLHNAWVIGNTVAIEARSTGIAASIVGVYYRNQRPKSNVPSQHVGSVGGKVEMELLIVDTRQLDTGSILHTMRDRGGNVYKWFASNIGFSKQKGQVIKVQGTVKKHETYRGECQTLLTRCKAV